MYIPKLSSKFVKDLLDEGLQVSVQFLPDGNGIWLIVTEPTGVRREFDVSSEHFLKDSISIIYEYYVQPHISIETQENDDGSTEYILKYMEEDVCYASVANWPGCLYIESVFTCDEYVRMGFATKLLTHIIRNTAEDSVEAMVAKNNPASLALFKKMKFRIVEDRGLGYTMRRRLRKSKENKKNTVLDKP